MAAVRHPMRSRRASMHPQVDSQLALLPCDAEKGRLPHASPFNKVSGSCACPLHPLKIAFEDDIHKGYLSSKCAVGSLFPLAHFAAKLAPATTGSISDDNMASSDKEDGVSYVHQDTGTGLQTAAGQGQYATDKYAIRANLHQLRVFANPRFIQIWPIPGGAGPGGREKASTQD